MKTINTFLILGFFIGFSNTLFGQTPDNSKLVELESAILNDMKISGAPGAVIGVVKDGQIVYQKAFGLSNVNTQIPVNNSTVFEMASVTKMFTAAALLTLCEKNDIDINAPIGNIIKDLSPKLSQVTIHQLLSHSSGIMDFWPNKNECKESLHEYFLNGGDDVFFEEPDKVFSYSNNGYALAGLLLATLNNSSYPKAVNDILLKPLGMNNTTFELREVTVNHFATGHVEGKAVPILSFITNPITQPAGGLFSNVSDMAKFAACIANNGIYDSKQIISQEVLKKMFGKYQLDATMYQYLGYPNSYYGYGLINYTYKGINFVGHPGEAVNQNSLLVVAPEHKTAIMVFSNAGYYPFINSIEKAVDIFLPVKKEEKKDIKFNQDLKQLIGRYYQSNFNKSKNVWLEIGFNDNKQLQITYSRDKKSYELTQFGENRFKFRDPDYKFVFEIGFYNDDSGKVKYLNYLGRAYVKE